MILCLCDHGWLYKIISRLHCHDIAMKLLFTVNGSVFKKINYYKNKIVTFPCFAKMSKKVLEKKSFLLEKKISSLFLQIDNDKIEWLFASSRCFLPSSSCIRAFCCNGWNQSKKFQFYIYYLHYIICKYRVWYTVNLSKFMADAFWLR